MNSTIETLDPVFGEISWRIDAGRIQLSGAAVPDVHIVRTGTAEPLSYIPIGTRDRANLTMTVGGRAVDLRPSKGRMTRRSYRIAVITEAGPLLFAPSSPSAARLIRGTSYRGDNELGVFEHFPDGAVDATWSEDVTAMGVTSKALQPEPEEVAIGYALAVGFGTGAQFFFAAFAAALGRMLPG